MKDSLRLKPIHINKHCWYYEEPKGVCIVQEIYKDNQYITTTQVYIPWKKLKESVIRKHKSGLLSIEDLYLST